MRQLVLILSSLAFSWNLLAGPAMTKLTIHVSSDTGKPLDRASVIVKFVSGRDKLKLYKKITTTWETKTNQEGDATIPPIPQGKIRVQVIASNYQTFGDLFDVDESNRTITIKLNPPQPQYSAH